MHTFGHGEDIYLLIGQYGIIKYPTCHCHDVAILQPMIYINVACFLLFAGRQCLCSPFSVLHSAEFVENAPWFRIEPQI
jgi:hypothetical protein